MRLAEVRQGSRELFPAKTANRANIVGRGSERQEPTQGMGLTDRSGKKRTGKDETDPCRYREAEGIGVPGKQTAAALILHLLHKKGVSLKS